MDFFDLPILIPLPSPPEDFIGASPEIFWSPACFGRVDATLLERNRNWHGNVAVKDHSNSNKVRIAPDEARFQYDRLIQNDDMSDYYALLGLADLKFNASEEEIRKSYKLVSLVVHPDKARADDQEKAEELFKATQKAYDVLCDPIKRREYDSSLPFDDELPKPGDVQTEAEFIAVYGPVFDRNALFSVKKPVPQLGTLSSSNEDVLNFYDFWFSFKSWRDFSYLNEHQIEQAGSREEKRWMERENAKLQAGKKKEEQQRIRTLVEQAYRQDPRIKRIKREEEEHKMRRKQDRQAQIQARLNAEEAARKAIENQERLEEERKMAEIEKAKADAKKLKTARSAFAKASRAANLSEDEVNILRPKLTLEQFLDMEKLLSDPLMREKGVHQFREAVKTHLQKEADAAAEMKYKRMKEIEEKEAQKEWSWDEEQALAKAAVKYPVGLKMRWEKITESINHHTNGNRGIQEVIKKSKEMEIKAQTVGKEQAFKIYADNMAREKIATEQTRLRNTKEDRNHLKENLEIEAEQAKRLQIMRQTEKETGALTNSSLNRADKKADDWTADEQSAFEGALKTVAKDAEDRWDQIAALVKTKNKKACVARFKAIREKILKARHVTK